MWKVGGGDLYGDVVRDTRRSDDGSGGDEESAVISTPNGISTTYVQNSHVIKRAESSADGAVVDATAMSLCGPGKLFGFCESEEMKIRAGRQLDEAIQLIPWEDKAAYLKAKEISPELISEESNPVRFLRFHQYNPWAAARRLVTYWKLRVQVFGSADAYRPLNLHDARTFGTENTINDAFQTGAMIILPPDEEGRRVLFIDRSKLLRPSHHRPRSSFMALQMLADSDVHDFVIVIVLRNAYGAQFDRRVTNVGGDLVLHGLPIRQARLHFICCPPERETSRIKRFIDFLVPKSLRGLGNYFGREGVVHLTKNTADAKDLLRPYGIKPEGLPPALGGVWDYDRWYDRFWYQQREIVGLQSIPATIAPSDTGFEAPTKDLAIRAGDTCPRGLTPSPPAETPAGESGISSLVRNTLAVYYMKLSAAGSTKTPSPPSAPALSQRRVGCPSEHWAGAAASAAPKLTAPALTSEVREAPGARFSPLERALESIPAGEKKAYEEARRLAPRLVELESDPLRFFRADSGHPLTAARRLVLYWETRKGLFGAHRAFLPLAIGGSGSGSGSALSNEDLVMLNSRFATFLPNDLNGRVVLFFRSTGLPTQTRSIGTSARLLQSDHDSVVLTWLRCVFYLLTVAAASEDARSNGLVFLTAHGNQDEYGTNWQNLPQLDAILQSGALPVKVAASHVVTFPPSTMKSVTGASSPPKKRFSMSDIKSTFLRSRTVIHFTTNGSALPRSLEDCGFCRNGLPMMMGGTTDVDADFILWWDRRRQHEAAAYGRGQSRTGSPEQAQIVENDDSLGHNSETTQSKALGDSETTERKSLGDSETKPRKKRMSSDAKTEEDANPPCNGVDVKRAKKRKMDALYARRKRYRERVEQEVFQMQFSDLKLENDRLVAEKARLEGLLKSAQKLVQQHEASTSETGEERHPWGRATCDSRDGGTAGQEQSPANGSQSVGTGLVAALGAGGIIPGAGVRASPSPYDATGSSLVSDYMRNVNQLSRSVLLQGSDGIGQAVSAMRSNQNDLLRREQLLASATGTAFERGLLTAEQGLRRNLLCRQEASLAGGQSSRHLHGNSGRLPTVPQSTLYQYPSRLEETAAALYRDHRSKNTHMDRGDFQHN